MHDQYAALQLSAERKKGQLSERLAAMRSSAFQPLANSPKVTTAVASKPTSSTSSPAQANDRQSAVNAAVKAERQRVAAVFSHKASQGRERTAADMLAHGALPASQIVAHLAALPTDTELERQRAADKHAQASSVWDKAYANLAADRGGK